jgi:hypothetical protein
LPGAGVVDDPDPLVLPVPVLALVPVPVPVPVFEVDEPVDEVDPASVLEVEPFDGWPVPVVVVEVVGDTVEVPVEVDEPSVRSSTVESVPARFGAAPPPPIIVDVPPVG